MNKDILVPVITGLFGVVIAPLIAQVIVPLVRRALRLDPADTAAAEKPGRRRRKPKSPLVPVLGGVAGLLLGFLLIRPMFASDCPPSAPTSVRITSPAEDAKVSRLVTVRGTVCHVPRGKRLWLMVLPEGVTAFYPQTGPVVFSGRHWSASAYVGIDSDGGRGFQMIAALADTQGAGAIQDYFTQSGTDFRGLEPLPGGIEIMSQVRVVRR